MATRKISRKPAPLAFNQNPIHYHNYSDRTVNQTLSPETSREENAFNRYLLCGQFYEVQLVGFNEYGAPVYRVFTTPDLTGQYNICLTRKGRKVSAIVTNYDAKPGTQLEPWQADARNLNREHSFELASPATVSDADLLAEAWEGYQAACSVNFGHIMDKVDRHRSAGSKYERTTRDF